MARALYGATEGAISAREAVALAQSGVAQAHSHPDIPPPTEEQIRELIYQAEVRREQT